MDFFSFEAVSFSAFLVLSWPVFEVSRGREVLGAFWPEAERLNVYGSDTLAESLL